MDIVPQLVIFTNPDVCAIKFFRPSPWIPEQFIYDVAFSGFWVCVTAPPPGTCRVSCQKI